jgi:mono/diheme cytochrome c family protein
MRRALLAILFPLALLGMITAGSASVSAQTKAPAAKAGEKPAKNPVAPTPASIASGKALFAKYCRFCHGDDAKGNGPLAPEGTHPPNLTDEKWDHGSTDADIFAVIRDGVGPKYDMKGYNSKMTAQEMWNVVNYLRSIGPQGKSH